MPKTKRYTFVIARESLNKSMQLSGFLDMLRHDAAQVIEVNSSMIVLQTTGHEPTRDRWHSFGLYILSDVAKGDYPDIIRLREQAAPKLPISKGYF